MTSVAQIKGTFVSDVTDKVNSYFDTRLTDGTLNARVSRTTSFSFQSCQAVVSFGSLESKKMFFKDEPDKSANSLSLCV